MSDTEKKETVTAEPVKEEKQTEEAKPVETDAIDINVEDLEAKLNSINSFEQKLEDFGARIEALEKTKGRVRIFTNKQAPVKPELTQKEIVEAFLNSKN